MTVTFVTFNYTDVPVAWYGYDIRYHGTLIYNMVQNNTIHIA